MDDHVEIYKRFELAVLGSSDGVWVWPDLDREEEWWSPRFYEILGFEDCEIDASVSEWRVRLHPDDVERTEAALKACLTRDDPFDIRYRMLKKDGEYCCVHARARLIRDEHGRPQQMAGTISDVTRQQAERRRQIRLQDQLQRLQRMESLGVLASGLAHDFNNLLLAVSANAESIALESPPESVSARAAEDIFAVIGRAKELTRLMTSFAGEEELDLRPLDLTATVSEMRSLLAAAVPKRVTLKFELESGLPRIEADRGRLSQAVLNLVLNAGQSYGDEGGCVTIRTSRGIDEPSRAVLVGDGEPDSLVTLEVCDQGSGISKASQSKIFDPFYTTKFSGRGLGLASVLGILKAHRGSVSLSSRKGAGSTFSLAFPPRPEVGDGPSGSGDSLPEALQDGLVIVADDDREVLDATLRLLGRSGVRALGTADEEELLSLCRSRQRELAAALVDMRMPGKGGAELCLNLRELHPSLPIVVMTGDLSVTGVPAPLKAVSGVEFILKPFRAAELVAALEQASKSAAAAGVEADREIG